MHRYTEAPAPPVLEHVVTERGEHLFCRQLNGVRNRICRISFIRPDTPATSISVYCQLHAKCSLCRPLRKLPDDYVDRVRQWLQAGIPLQRDQADRHKAATLPRHFEYGRLLVD